MNLILIGIISAFLMAHARATDDCQDDNKPVDCYQCSTLDGESYCGDPFNHTAKTYRCHGACAKWIKYSHDGTRHVIRTCSKDMKMEMHVHLVCMHESNPGKGKLCFCRSRLCNSANSIYILYTQISDIIRSPQLAFCIVTSLFTQRHLVGILDFTHWWAALGFVIYCVTGAAVGVCLLILTHICQRLKL